MTSIYIAVSILFVIAFFVYASCNIRSNVYLKAFGRKRTEEKIVALTFDDGPHPVQTAKVLQVLRAHQAPACFFCIGANVKGNEALLRQITEEGHLVGNHSFGHANLFPLYSLPRMKKDLQACQFALEQVTSQKISLFRPPFGVTNPTVARAVRRLGYIPIGWNIRTFDTQRPAVEKVLKRIRNKLRPGSVILLHDRMPDSDLLLKEILNLIREQGYTVVRLDKML